MPSRRSHKKSRAGCQTCKKRRMKCDEIHPRCGNCLNHGITCDFQALSIIGVDDSVVSLPKASRSPQGVNFPSGSIIDNVFPRMGQDMEVSRRTNLHAKSHLLELHLLYTYSTLTSKTLMTPDMEKLWSEIIPTLAFSAPYLMDALFAITALHLRSLQPDNKTLAQTSHAYMASALSQYKLLLDRHIDASNAEALFVTATLIGFFTQASRASFGESTDEVYELPLEWFHSYQGVKNVVLNSWQWLRNSARVLPIIRLQPALSFNLSSNGYHFFDSLLEGMDEQLQRLEEHLRLETRKAYEHSVAFLNWTHQKADRNKLMGFPAIVSMRFVEMLGEKNSRTLVIVGCFFAMIKAVDDIWWLKGVARKECKGIYELLPREWRPKMQWAMRVSASEYPLAETVWGRSSDFEELFEDREDERHDVLSHIDRMVLMSSN